MKNFIQNIYDKHEKDWIDKIVKLRNDIVLAGKKTEKFKRFLKEKKLTRDGLADEHRLDVARSCAVEDCLLLYLLVKHYRPINIMEIGTWFGASTYVMAQSLIDNNIDGKIYTCDKNNLFLEWDYYTDKVVYFNKKSGKFFNKINGIKFDMVFVDGALKLEECQTILGYFNGKILYVNHDWYISKGQNNLKYMRKLLGNSIEYVLPPVENADIFMDDGQKINNCTYIICSKEFTNEIRKK